MNKKIWNMLTGWDQLGNTFLACMPYPLTWPGVGAPDETISSTIGKLERKHNGTIPKKWFFARIIHWTINKIDPGHFTDAIEDDEGLDE